MDKVNNQDAIFKKSYGKGKLWFIAAELPDYSLAALYQQLLVEYGVKPMAQLYREKSNDPPPDVEMHKVAHNAMTAWYFMNTDSYPKIIRMKSNDLQDAVVVDPFAQRTLEVVDNNVVLLLPPHVRTVIVSGPEEKIEKRFGTPSVLTLAEMRKQKERIITENAKTKEKVRQGICLDLKKLCNSGFDNQQNWATDSAWFDGNNKYLKGIPWQSVVLDGVTCDLIRNDFNDNRTCIAMKSQFYRQGRREIENISVNEKAQSISFFQAVTHGKVGEKVMTYHINYDDGSTLDLPVVVGDNIGDWNIADNNATVKKMMAWENDKKLGFFRWEWKNPYPQKAISSIGVTSSESQSTAIIVAITIHPSPKQVKTIYFDKWKKSFHGKAFEETKDGFEMFRSSVTLSSPDGKRLPIPKDKIKSAMIRYSIKVKPDEFGNIASLIPAPVILYGSSDDGRQVKSSSLAINRGHSSLKSSIQKLDGIHNTGWWETAMPLNVIIKEDRSNIFTNITEMKLWTHQNTGTVLIRNLRVEYEE